ncbi:aldolase [Mesorhizobium sp. BH1-1-5]|uniref:3-oxo-tetronate 4-phosphate decarboxylase n=1 Tax=unclassified Mesorhizobium TaxID=325217 RepID=UPI001127B55C|nr:MULTISPECIES: 3-oxo-tetronate 4-phosphate decarboxylase [unclassified Mesorhizobium]MBZ9988871.1 aldolase [Mesorhizobium sp. BH1-1-5]TPJ61059.1 aldolase [Mesorhizobium sp. B2-7-1]
MTLEEQQLRDEICRWGDSMFKRGYTAGSSGNLSARLPDGFLVTPTNSCLGYLEPARLSKLDPAGVAVSGDAPTKEIPLHLAFYEARPQAGGVVHLHSTYATALSCLEDTDPEDTIPSITPYVVMRVGRVPLIPYTHPGSTDTGILVKTLAPDHAAVLLANHGPVVSGRSFRDAVFAAEELEETAKLVLLTRQMSVRRLSNDLVTELDRRRKS